MQIFEIRIFGNVSGFSEMKLGTVNHLMDGSTIKMIDYESIQTDAFSIAYAPEYYVLSYHFTFPHSASSSFRSQRASASIVIKRGFKLISPLETLKKIKSALVGYANSMKGNFPQLLASKTKDLYALVEQEIATAPEQAMLNWSANGAVSKAIIAFDEENQLSKLLNSPFRREFRLDSEHGVILLIYRKQASALWPQLKDRYKAIKIENYDAVDQIEVEFPDGHRMFVDGRNAEIDYALYKNYYKNYHFKGSLSEKMNEWKVRVIGNRYIIGVTLEPEVREYQVRFVDAWTGDDCIPQTVSFSLGKFDNKRRVLKLTGEENAKTFAVQVSEDFHVVDTRRTDNKIIVKLEKQYTYPTEQIWGALIKQGVKIPEFCIEDASGKKRYRITNHAVYHFPLPHEKAFVVFPETDEFLETKCKYQTNSENGYSLQRKQFMVIVFNIKHDNRPVLSSKSKIKYTVLNGKQNEVNVNTFPFTLKLANVPTGDFHYTCQVKGYKEYQGIEKISQNEERVSIIMDLQPNSLTKVTCYAKRNRVALLAFMCGILLGCIITRSLNNGKSQTIYYDFKEPYNESILTIDSLKSTISELEARLVDFGSKDSSLHEEIVKTLLHMNMKDRERYRIKERDFGPYNVLYRYLNSDEKNDLNRVFNHPEFYHTQLPRGINSTQEALEYLDFQRTKHQDIPLDMKNNKPFNEKNNSKDRSNI